MQPGRWGVPVWWPQNRVSAFCRWCGSVNVVGPWPSALTGAVRSRVWSGWDENQHLKIRDHGPQPEKGEMLSPGWEWGWRTHLHLLRPGVNHRTPAGSSLKGTDILTQLGHVLMSFISTVRTWEAPCSCLFYIHRPQRHKHKSFYFTIVTRSGIISVIARSGKNTKGLILH